MEWRDTNSLPDFNIYQHSIQHIYNKIFQMARAVGWGKVITTHSIFLQQLFRKSQISYHYEMLWNNHNLFLLKHQSSKAADMCPYKTVVFHLVITFKYLCMISSNPATHATVVPAKQINCFQTSEARDCWETRKAYYDVYRNSVTWI